MLTGTSADIAKTYRVYFSKADENDDDDYLVDHSIAMYPVGPAASSIDFFTQNARVMTSLRRSERILWPLKLKCILHERILGNNQLVRVIIVIGQNNRQQ